MPVILGKKGVPLPTLGARLRVSEQRCSQTLCFVLRLSQRRSLGRTHDPRPAQLRAWVSSWQKERPFQSPQQLPRQDKHGAFIHSFTLSLSTEGE